MTGAVPNLAKPRLRGVSHQWAAIVSVAAGVLLLVLSPHGQARLAAGIYALAMTALFATSAVYHRVNWGSVAARMRMRRLDHSMIFVLIAGTYTPFALLALDGTLSDVILIIVWAGAVAGILLHLAWSDAPKAVTVIPYIALGWVAVASFPSLAGAIGPVAISLVALGGLLYTVGAVIYALGKPDPVPGVFGYHEVCHALGIAAAARHYAAIAGFVRPDA